MTDEVFQYINPDLVQEGPPGWLVIVERPFTPGKVQMELWFAGISDHGAAIEAVRERVSDAVSIRAPQEVSLSLKEALSLHPGEVRRL
jgi:hypothetical protein